MSPDRAAFRKVSDTFSDARLTTAHRKVSDTCAAPDHDAHCKVSDTCAVAWASEANDA